MEEKKQIKVSLLTALLVVAIIVIIVMGALLYMQKTEADRQNIEVKNTASELQENIDSIISNVDDDNLQENIDSTISNVNDDNLKETTIKTVLTPSGFSGSSLKRVILYSDNTVYVANYDGAGYEETNIVDKTLIAKNVETIEYNGQGKDFKSIIVKGIGIEIIETSYNWIEFDSGNTANEKYNTYIAGLKKSMEKTKEEYSESHILKNLYGGDFLETVGIYPYIEIQNNGDAYLNLEKDSAVGKKYGEKYKVATNIVNVGMEQHGHDAQAFLWFINDLGEFSYINIIQDSIPNLELKKIDNLKNIVDVTLMYNGVADILVAIDIEGNILKIER